MRRYIVGGLVVALICLLLIGVGWAQSPLTASQVITLEHGPDGTWLSQAWIVELQARPDTRLAVVYDLWQHSPDARDWALAYRQWDISGTWQRAPATGWPLSITVGSRWRVGDTGGSLGGAGPWTYATVVVGW